MRKKIVVPVRPRLAPFFEIPKSWQEEMAKQYEEAQKRGEKITFMIDGLRTVDFGED